jgi:hypothetical protein
MPLSYLESPFIAIRCAHWFVVLGRPYQKKPLKAIPKELLILFNDKGIWANQIRPVTTYLLSAKPQQ